MKASRNLFHSRPQGGIPNVKQEPSLDITDRENGEREHDLIQDQVKAKQSLDKKPGDAILLPTIKSNNLFPISSNFW